MRLIVYILCCVLGVSTNHVRNRYRPHYHLSPSIGWLNDPAAFAYYNSQYHLFYQYNPYSGFGPMHWGHAVSNNLVDWEDYPIALNPKEAYDLRGCLSGSAIVHQNFLILFYTGIYNSENSTLQTQNVAVSTDGVLFQKYTYNPIIRTTPPGTWQFRHPKVWHFKCLWRMVIGNSTPDKRGRIYMYTSTDLYSWQAVSVIAESYDLGYMWEHPDFFKLNGLDVLIFSAQGIRTHEFPYNTGYVVGDFDYFTNTFKMEVSKATFHVLDYGHDFHGAYTMEVNGRRLLIAWMGSWIEDYEESADGWTGIMTLVRELSLSKDCYIIMSPVREVIGLRTSLIENAFYEPGEVFEPDTNIFELLINATDLGEKVVLDFYLGNGRNYVITYLVVKNVILVDKGGIDGVRRAFWKVDKSLYWRIFVDSSSVEVFCGDGEVVFSSRIYPQSDISVRVGGDTDVLVTMYSLRSNIRNSADI